MARVRAYHRVSHRVRRACIGVTAFAAVLGIAAVVPQARAATHPASAEAVLLLDGTQTAPNDGFNMQIDDNGFGTAGGTLSETHMFCVNSTIHYRCGIGTNDLIRVQGTPGAAGLSDTQANELAWLLTHRNGYTNEETQSAIWCITDPGNQPAIGNSDALCQAAHTSAVPAVATLVLDTLGASTVSEGTSAHFALSTNAPSVHLAVSDGGALPVLCGSAAGNASASIIGGDLVQNAPATQRDFELCVTRSNIVGGQTAATLSATLDATHANIQPWVHPIAPTQCQGLIDVDLTSSRVSVSADATWLSTTGWLTVTKSTFGDIPTGATFTVELRQDTNVVGTHTFPDTDGDPWSHTFTGLVPGTYSITETATGGAAHVVVTPSGPITIDQAQGQTVALQNQFVGQLRLTKQTDIPVDRTFPFDVNCSYNGESVGDWNNPIDLAAGASYTTPDLPAGSTCIVKEVDTGNAISTLIARDDLSVQSQSVGTQANGIVIRNGEVTAVVFTNTFSQGSTEPSTTIGASSSSLGSSSSAPGSVNGQGNTTSPVSNHDNGLATTGSESRPIVGFAGLLLLAGAALVFGTRRHRRLRV